MQGRAEALLYLSVHSDVKEHLCPQVHGPAPMDPWWLTTTYAFWTWQDTGKQIRSISHHIMEVLGTGVRVRAATLVSMSQAESGGFTAETKSW